MIIIMIKIINFMVIIIILNMYFCRYPGSGRFEGIPGEYPMEPGNTEYLIHLTFVHIYKVS